MFIKGNIYFFSLDNNDDPVEGLLMLLLLCLSVSKLLCLMCLLTSRRGRRSIEIIMIIMWHLKPCRTVLNTCLVHYYSKTWRQSKIQVNHKQLLPCGFMWFLSDLLLPSGKMNKGNRRRRLCMKKSMWENLAVLQLLTCRRNKLLCCC